MHAKITSTSTPSPTPADQQAWIDYRRAAIEYMTTRWEFRGDQFGPWPAAYHFDREDTHHQRLKRGKQTAQELLDARAYLSRLAHPDRIVSYISSAATPEDVLCNFESTHTPGPIVHTKSRFPPSDEDSSPSPHSFHSSPSPHSFHSSPSPHSFHSSPSPHSFHSLPEWFIERLSLIPEIWSATRSVCKFWYAASASKELLFQRSSEVYAITDAKVFFFRAVAFPSSTPVKNFLGPEYGNGCNIMFMSQHKFFPDPYGTVVTVTNGVTAQAVTWAGCRISVAPNSTREVNVYIDAPWGSLSTEPKDIPLVNGRKIKSSADLLEYFFGISTGWFTIGVTDVVEKSAQWVFDGALFDLIKNDPEPTAPGWDHPGSYWDQVCHPKMLQDPGYFCLKPPVLADYPGVAEILTNMNLGPMVNFGIQNGVLYKRQLHLVFRDVVYGPIPVIAPIEVDEEDLDSEEGDLDSEDGDLDDELVQLIQGYVEHII